MLYYIAISILEMFNFILLVFIFTFLINYIFIEDFRILLYKIKEVTFSGQTNKVTSIKNLIYNYFF